MHPGGCAVLRDPASCGIDFRRHQKQERWAQTVLRLVWPWWSTLCIGVGRSPFTDKVHGDHPELLGRPALEEETRILRRHTQDASGERLGLAEHLIKDFTSMGVFEAADAGAVQVQHVLCHHGPDFVRETRGASGVVSCGSFHL